MVYTCIESHLKPAVLRHFSGWKSPCTSSLIITPLSPFTLPLVFEHKGLPELLYSMFGPLQTGMSSPQGYSVVKALRAEALWGL